MEPSVYPQRIFKPFITNSSCSFGGSTFYGISLPTEGISEIGFYPNDPFYSEIIKNVAKTVNLTPIGWETEDELNLWIRNETIEKSVISIEFDNATHVSHKNSINYIYLSILSRRSSDTIEAFKVHYTTATTRR